MCACLGDARRILPDDWPLSLGTFRLCADCAVLLGWLPPSAVHTSFLSARAGAERERSETVEGERRRHRVPPWLRAKLARTGRPARPAATDMALMGDGDFFGLGELERLECAERLAESSVF